MIVHRLKILDVFANDVLEGNKTFELRYNDRNYQKGDLIEFIVVDGEGRALEHPLNGRRFEIVYFLEEWGLKDGYVALGIRPQEV